MPANARSKGGQEALPRGSAGSRVTARVVLAALLAALALWIGWHFLNALVWAVVVTVAAWPAYRRFVRLFAPKHRDVSAPLIFTIVLGIVVFIPLAIAIGEVAATSNLVFDTLARFRESGIPTPDWLGALPFGDHATRWWNTNLADPANARQLLGNPDKQAQAEWTRGVGVEILHRSFMMLLSLSATFVLLRSGPALGDRVLDTADKFLGDPGERMARKMVETIRGTVNGTVVVAVAEGIVIGAGYAIAGVPRPFLFAILTAAFAMIPLGAWAVFTTAALVLAQEGSVTAAVGVFCFGAAVMIVGDTMVWPWLVGNQARLPFLVALIGIFGGLQTFGLVGLFVGPVIMAAFWIVVREWLARRQPSAN
jgi:predicted PurR-regulated permease PerM